MRRRAESDGAVVDGDVRWPGASSTFALFAEVLLTGVLVAVLSLPVLTLPAALAAGSGHLRRFLRAEDSGLRALWADYRAALRGGLLLGLVAFFTAFVLLADLVIVGSWDVPWAPIVLAAGAAGLIAIGVLLAAFAADWTPEGWQIRDSLRRLGRDAIGTLLLVVAVCLAGVVGWQLAPLTVPAVGCVVFAAIVVRERRKPADRG